LAKSTAVRNSVLDAILGTGQTLSAATLYLALYTVAPTEDGGGTEVTGGSYARLSVSNVDATFPTAVGGSKANAITLAMATPTAPWGTVVAFALHDHATNDSIILWGLLDASVVVDTSDPVQFAAGDLAFDET
jgi:hypothetical protein